MDMQDTDSPQKSTPEWKKILKITFGVLVVFVFGFLLLILSLRWVNPAFTAFTLQEDWDALGTERYNLSTYWVSADSIPSHLKLAAISSEDQRFEDHWGLDIEAINKAVSENKRREKRRGASTITQQVAKNLFLTPSQSYTRKGVEALIAVTIEVMWPKERILEVYLNIAEFGPGIFGIGKASNAFFDKHITDLVPNESARLAAVLPSPKRMTAEPPSPFVEERSRWILVQMTHLSGISYLPKPEPRSDTSDSVQFQDMPQIQRADFPDSVFYSVQNDPLLDNAWFDSLQ